MQVRIEQVLMMNPPLLLCYQLGQLTDFYCSLVVDILGAEAALSQTVGSCRDTANRWGNHLCLSRPTTSVSTSYSLHFCVSIVGLESFGCAEMMYRMGATVISLQQTIMS